MSVNVLLAAEVALILAAVVGTVWMKREGDREWRRHQRRMVTFQLVLNTAKFTAAVVAMGPALAKVGRAAADFEQAMAKMRAQMKAANPTESAEES